jgi:hypothetical protein
VGSGSFRTHHQSESPSDDSSSEDSASSSVGVVERSSSASSIISLVKTIVKFIQLFVVRVLSQIDWTIIVVALSSSKGFVVAFALGLAIVSILLCGHQGFGFSLGRKQVGSGGNSSLELLLVVGERLLVVLGVVKAFLLLLLPMLFEILFVIS